MSQTNLSTAVYYFIYNFCFRHRISCTVLPKYRGQLLVYNASCMYSRAFIASRSGRRTVILNAVGSRFESVGENRWYDASKAASSIDRVECAHYCIVWLIIIAVTWTGFSSGCNVTLDIGIAVRCESSSYDKSFLEKDVKKTSECQS